MAEHTIKHRNTGAVLYTGDGESLRDVVEAAVSDGAYLAGAKLDGAYLAGANLGGANLAGADLARAYLGGADLANANLAGADLARAYLGGANLVGADLAGANLAGANLVGADLAGANLAGANLAGANLAGAKLIGKRPIIQIGPIGSRSSYVVAYLTDAGVRVRAGCFFGSLDKFRAAVIKTHGESIHAREYAAAIALIEMHAECWTPAAVVSEAA